jgi:hypothetical protein
MSLVFNGRADPAKCHRQRPRRNAGRSITPTLDYLENHGVSVYEIDASGTIEEVAENIHKTLGI